VVAFNFLKSTHISSFPFFLGTTTTIGDNQMAFSTSVNGVFLFPLKLFYLWIFSTTCTYNTQNKS
jgi:hypothetical protein